MGRVVTSVVASDVFCLSLTQIFSTLSGHVRRLIMFAVSAPFMLSLRIRPILFSGSVLLWWICSHLAGSKVRGGRRGLFPITCGPAMQVKIEFEKLLAMVES